uniref:Putative ovule protein n=1 Tax=Solanum chacoense TaxID=4108 RepID=A0A0V0H0G4_SOLCH
MGESVPKTCDEPCGSTRVTGDHPADLMKRSALAQISGEINLGPIAHLGQKHKGNSETHLGVNETSREEQVRDINGNSTIKTLASQFPEATKLWEK